MKKRLMTLFSMFTIVAVYAQDGTNTSGGDANGSGGSSAYSVGQPIYKTNSGSTGSSSEGVQKAYEIYIVGIENVDNISIEMTLYPNPTNADVTLRIDEEYTGLVSYSLLDLNGRLLARDEINDLKTFIPTGILSSGTYFLHVSNQNKIIKTFKIIKN